MRFGRLRSRRAKNGGKAVDFAVYHHRYVAGSVENRVSGLSVMFRLSHLRDTCYHQPLNKRWCCGRTAPVFRRCPQGKHVITGLAAVIDSENQPLAEIPRTRGRESENGSEETVRGLRRAGLRFLSRGRPRIPEPGPAAAESTIGATDTGGTPFGRSERSHRRDGNDCGDPVAVSKRGKRLTLLAVLQPWYSMTNTALNPAAFRSA